VVNRFQVLVSILNLRRYVKVHLDSYHMNIEERSLRQAVKCCGDSLGRAVRVEICSNWLNAVLMAFAIKRLNMNYVSKRLFFINSDVRRYTWVTCTWGSRTGASWGRALWTSRSCSLV
jgi:hypothetical protein